MSRADRSVARRRLDGLLRGTERGGPRPHQPDPWFAGEGGPDAGPLDGSVRRTRVMPEPGPGGSFPPTSPLDGGPPERPAAARELPRQERTSESDRPVGGWVPTAVRVAAADYRETYGQATDLSWQDAPRVRVRWAVPWRLAASAATVVALVVGATIIRATALAPGDPVVLPTPAVVPGDGPGAAASSTGAADARAASTASSTSVAQVVVHVVGAVRSPGVVRLPPGARVQDAVTAAGGALPEADLDALNLARVVADGEQLTVPRPGEPATAASATGVPGAASGTVDLNSATLADLDALPGIGPVLAQRILDRRQQQRFSSVDELGEVSGIGPTLLERLRPLVRV